ncbi:hypothetical protein PGB90_004256 [Kerria lacca]
MLTVSSYVTLDTIKGLPDIDIANSPWRGRRNIDKGTLGFTFGVTTGMDVIFRFIGVLNLFPES